MEELKCSFCGEKRGSRIMACIKCHDDAQLDWKLEQEGLKVISLRGSRNIDDRTVENI